VVPARNTNLRQRYAEVKADGIDVAQMNALLLKKVEELTLYVIELEKRISDFEQK
jgi:hypothetical protein